MARKGRDSSRKRQTKEVIKEFDKLLQNRRPQHLRWYSIKWVEDLDSQVDFVNGFTETYGDPLGMKASWDRSLTKNVEATKRTQTIATTRNGSEDNSPIDPKLKKKVKGVSARRW